MARRKSETINSRRDAASRSPRRVTSRSLSRKSGRLDAIVRELEDTELPLDKALVLLRGRHETLGFCHKQLEEAEGKVEILSKKAGGKSWRSRSKQGRGEVEIRSWKLDLNSSEPRWTLLASRF